MKELYILRGLPGSGKSHLAKALGGIICSADDYFMVDGEYRFDLARLQEAHRFCFRRCMEALLNQEPVVIIDNTNIRRSDFDHYVKAGEAYGYSICFARPPTPWRDNPDKCFEKTVHGVPLETIERMKLNWEY